MSRSPAARLGAATLVILGAVVALAVPAAVASAQQAYTGLGIKLVDAPSDRRDDPRASAYVVDHVGPGASISRRVEVRNDTGRPVEVDVYPGAAALEDGSFAIAPREAQNELTTWMSVTPASLSLAQGERQMVTVEIRVPEDASPGERYGAVVAELPPADGPGEVKIATRVGVRTYLSVGAGGEPASDFAIESLTAARSQDGVPEVRALVRNTGGRALDMNGTLSLTNGPGGLAAGPFPAEVGTTLGIGASAPVVVKLDPRIPAGPWTARLDLRSGLLERAAEATITFPEAAGEVGPRVDAEPVPLSEDPNVVIPIAVGLLVLAALMLLWLFLKKRTKREDDDDEPTEGLAVPAPRRSDQPVRS